MQIPVSLQLNAYTILLIVNTESITELYNVHTGGDDVEKKKQQFVFFFQAKKRVVTMMIMKRRETGPMITEIWTNKEGHRPTVVRLPSSAHYRPLFNQPISAVTRPIKLTANESLRTS